MKTLSEIRNANPGLEIDPTIESVAEDFDGLKALRTLKNSEAGRTVLKMMDADAVSRLSQVIDGYRTLPHAELIALIAYLDAVLGQLSQIRGNSRFESLQETVDEYLKKK